MRAKGAALRGWPLVRISFKKIIVFIKKVLESLYY